MSTQTPTPTPAPAPPSATRRRSSTPDRRILIISALVLFGALAVGIFVVAATSDSGPRKDTQGQLPEAGGAKPHIIPRPNEGKAPERAGDRGGTGQLALMGLIVGALLLIGVFALRGGSKARANRAAWLAAAEADPPGEPGTEPTGGEPRAPVGSDAEDEAGR